MSTTQIPFSAVVESVSDGVVAVLEEATQITRVSSQAYLAGLGAVVEQQKLARESSRHWLNDLAGAQSDLAEQIIGSLTAATNRPAAAAKRSAVVSKRAAPDAVQTTKSATKPARRKETATSRRTRRKATTPAPAAALAAAVGAGLTTWTSDGYDALTAAEIVDKLPGFSQRDLGEVEIYERAHQARRTVLQRIESLRGPEPVAGYDELTVPDVQAQLRAGDEARATAVRDYERSHKQRDGVLNAAQARIDNA